MNHNPKRERTSEIRVRTEQWAKKGEIQGPSGIKGRTHSTRQPLKRYPDWFWRRQWQPNLQFSRVLNVVGGSAETVASGAGLSMPEKAVV